MLAITAKTPSKRIRKIRNLVGLQSLIQIDLTVISYTNSGLQIINTPIKKARTAEGKRNEGVSLSVLL